MNKLAILFLVVGVIGACNTTKKRETPTANKSDEIVKVPEGDKAASESELQLVKSKIAIVTNAKEQSSKRREALVELIPYASNYASVSTAAVKLAKSGVSDLDLLMGLAQFFHGSKLSSPSIIESEIALYDTTIKNGSKTNAVREVIITSFKNKTTKDSSILTPTVINTLKKMVEQEALLASDSHSSKNLAPLALQGYGVRLVNMADGYIGAPLETAGKYSQMVFEHLFYFASLGEYSFKFDNSGYVPQPVVSTTYKGALSKALGSDAVGDAIVATQDAWKWTTDNVPPYVQSWVAYAKNQVKWLKDNAAWDSQTQDRFVQAMDRFKM